MSQGNIEVTLDVVRTAVSYTLEKKKKNVWRMFISLSDISDKVDKRTMKIYHHLKNPIIRHSGSFIWEKLPILWVIITIQHANCFSICRLCFHWALVRVSELRLDRYLMRPVLIKSLTFESIGKNQPRL